MIAKFSIHVLNYAMRKIKNYACKDWIVIKMEIKNGDNKEFIAIWYRLNICF